MGLDLSQTVSQINQVTTGLKTQRSNKSETLSHAKILLEQANPDKIRERQNTGKFSWHSVAEFSAEPYLVHDLPSLPADYGVVAVDGSHIDVDRHSPATCYLINLGFVTLRYGELAKAELWSTPTLYHEDGDLAITDPATDLNFEPVEGQILAIKRAVEEVNALADAVESLPKDLPILALLDGSLTLVGLANQNQSYITEALLNKGLLPALKRLKDLAGSRLLAVASYISLPRTEQVVTTLRLQSCPFPEVNCLSNCYHLRRGERHCDIVSGINDRDLFSHLLNPKQRSQTYRSAIKIMDLYAEHRVHFWYLNLGQEIARVEMPEWAALSPETIRFAHAAILAQVDKGSGYPVALSEAHEQAVITGRDRENFTTLVEESLKNQKISNLTSEKARSKRTRWL